MTELASNTILKLYSFDTRIKCIFEKHGHTSLPFEGISIQNMIEESRKDITDLFNKIWGSPTDYHLLGKFYEFKGNVYAFFLNLDSNNRELLTNKDW